MANNFKIGAGIALDGEADFKRAISGINKDINVLGSEMKKVTAQFADNADSMEALTAKQDVYNKRADEQKKKIDTITTALEASKKEYGDNSDQVKNWQIKLNNAETDLAKTESSLKKTSDQINNFGKESDDSGKEVESAGKKAKNSGDDAEKGKSGWSKLGDGLKNAGELAGKAVLALGAAVGAGMTAALGASLKATAEIEQQLGGVEAVFEDNADEVKAWAASSAGSMGMSANAALETANKMGSLFQGSGIEADKAAEMTMNMSQRAADVASVMGVDLATAMEAVTGAAKGNFTMMDNLGVAMNATTLEAYAQSKGIDTAWKSMTNAEKNGLAYQMFMEQTQKYAGNFSKENTTLAGSFDVLKGSFQNVLSSLSDPEMLDAAISQFVESVKGIANSIEEVLPDLLSGLSTAITEAIPVLAPVLLSVTDSVISIFIDAFTKYLPDIVNVGIDVVKKLIEGIMQNIPALISSATEILLSLTNALIDMLPMLIESGLQIITQLALGIADALPELIPTIVDTVLTIVNTLIDNVDMLIDAAIAIIIALSDGLIAALPQLIEKIPEIIIKLVEAITNNLPKIVEAGIQIIIALAGALIKAIPKLLAKIPEIISAIVSGFADYYSKMGEIGLNLIKGLWQGISDAASWLKEKISGFVDDVVGNIKEFFGIHSPSTVMAEMGGYLSEGLANGITDKAGLVTDAMSKLNKGISANANLTVSAAGSNTATIPNTINSALQSGSITVQQYFTGKTPSPAESARQTKNGLRQLALQLS